MPGSQLSWMTCESCARTGQDQGHQASTFQEQPFQGPFSFLMPLVVQAEPVAVIFKDAAEGQELQAMHAAAAAAVV